MRQLNKGLVIGVFTLFFGFLGKSQDIHFSQYLETPTTLNPALLGFNYDNRVIANYRTQWGTLGKSYQTMGFTYDGGTGKKLKGKRIGYGINIIRDVAGDAKMSTLLPSLGLSYSQKINKKLRFGAGFQFGLNYRTIDVSNLRWGAQYQNYEYNGTALNGETTPRSSLLSTDVGTGFHFSYSESESYFSSKDGSKFDAGFSTYHFILPPKSSFIVSDEKLDRRYVFYANGEFFIPNMKIALDPSVIFMSQGKSHEFITGLMFKYIILEESKFTSIKKPSAIAFGGSYRYKDAIIPAFLFMYGTYAIGVSYDINVSQLTPASKLNGGLEITLRYNMNAGYGRNLGRSDTKASY